MGSKINFKKEIILLENILKSKGELPIRQLSIDIYEIRDYAYMKIKRFRKKGFVVTEKRDRSLYPKLTPKGLTYLKLLKLLEDENGHN